MAPVATPLFFYRAGGPGCRSAAWLVITRRNAVHSALALIVTLLAVSGLYLMLYAPFVAGVQIIVYAGGIMVLFLFVIMLVNIERTVKERQFNRIWPVGLAAACALLAIVRFGVREGQGAVSGARTAAARGVEHATDWRHAVRRSRQDGSIYVRLRDRLAAVAGGDSGGGDYGEEKDLVVGRRSFVVRRSSAHSRDDQRPTTNYN